MSRCWTEIPALVVLMIAALVFAPGVGIDRARAAEPNPQGWDRALTIGAPVRVTAEQVTITGGLLSGLALRGAWALHGDHKNFGGFSGLLIAEGKFIAVSDIGWWLGSALDLDGDNLLLANAQMAPMRNAEGNLSTKSAGDAEGLTRQGKRLVVSFERDHRLMFLQDAGRLGGAIRAESFKQLKSNKSLEALATLPDGRLIALVERADADGVPMFVVDTAGVVTEARLPQIGNHSVTGADVGPDGRLYLVLRDYSPLIGVSIRVMRYNLGPDGFPQSDSAETLAAFEVASGIDNMEGIALDRGPDNAIRLWLISDDNFGLIQRTLLVLFDVLP